jgi:quaternary ammonium compound-resistance protein SugE
VAEMLWGFESPLAHSLTFRSIGGSARPGSSVARELTVPWFLLALAGLLEIVWATALDRSEGFTRPWPAAVTVVGLAGSMALLGLALRDLPLGTAYAVWVGIGATGTALVGMAWLGEPVSLVRLGFVAMIVGGVVGLRLTA